MWHKTQKWWFWKKSYFFSSNLETFKKVQNKLCDFVSHYTFFQFNNTVWWYWWCEVIVFQRIMMRFFLHEIKETKGQLWSNSTDFKGTFIIIIIAIMYFCIPTYTHCLRSEKKVHSDFDFFTFYLIKCVNWVLPGLDPGN